MSSRRADTYFRKGLSRWEDGHRLLEWGRPVWAARRYQQSTLQFFGYVHETGWRPTAPPSHSARVFHGMGELARQTAETLAGLGGRTRHTLRYARIAVAVTHLADPTRGDPFRIRFGAPAIGPPVFSLDPRSGEELTPHVRTASAAAARLYLARLMLGYPGYDDGERWPIGTGQRIFVTREVARFRRAVLPSCVGLDHGAEARRLADEAVAMYAGLCRVAPQYRDPARKAAAARAEIHACCPNTPDLDRRSR
ncbi:hypothetical protein [Streptomyces sp. SID3343]|uniref:hypothetical protein n=1 Tax=Streptomyces sp. SID3343 TaxID=2690260 RepID=UPI00136C6284|nr:hypothetical protein [Streptomyces sp. SID3343]MYW02403.1 hypothetical protein [Streptomyces sp. SID3343]